MNQERKELEDTIFENLKEIQNELLYTADRVRLALNSMEREVEGSARIVPEDKTLQSDLNQIASNIYGLSSEMNVRMKDYDKLLELIEEIREADNSE